MSRLGRETHFRRDVECLVRKEGDLHESDGTQNHRRGGGKTLHRR
jgi:hypothetical protein